MIFGQRLQELRKQKGLSQQQLADALKVSQAAINNWERGKREPSIAMIETVADYFSCSGSYLMGWEEEEVQNTGLDETEFSEEELNEIQNYIQFIKSKRNKN